MKTRALLHLAALWAVAGPWLALVRASEAGALHGLALVAGLALAWREREPAPREPQAGWSWAAGGALAGYAGAMWRGPTLLALLLAALSLGFLAAASARAPERSLGLVVLLSAAAPVVDVLQALLGAPLRLGVAQCAAFLVRTTGLAVEADGVTLVDGPRTIFVDPACSGLRYLACAYLLAGLLAALFRLRARATLALCALGLAAAFVANVLRSTSLVWLECASGPAARAEWLHAGVGLGGFALACALLLLCATRLRERAA